MFQTSTSKIAFFVGALALSLQLKLGEAALGASCSNDAQCNATANEQCGSFSLSPALSPGCRNTVCICKPCYVNVNNKCLPKQYLKLGDACNTTFDNVIDVAGAECPRQQSRVTCKQGFYVSNNRCLYNRTCDTRIGCSGLFNAVCNASRLCECSFGTMWDDETQSCVARGYGDDCSKDEDCNFPNAGFNGITYTGYTKFGTGNCSLFNGMKKCICRSDYTMTLVGFVNGLTDSYDMAMLCLPRAVAQNTQPTNGTCSLPDPLKSISATIQVCDTLSVCTTCPSDGGSSLITGTCRSFISDKATSDSKCRNGATMLLATFWPLNMMMMMIFFVGLFN